MAFNYVTIPYALEIAEKGGRKSGTKKTRLYMVE